MSLELYLTTLMQMRRERIACQSHQFTMAPKSAQKCYGTPKHLEDLVLRAPDGRQLVVPFDQHGEQNGCDHTFAAFAAFDHSIHS